MRIVLVLGALACCATASAQPLDVAGNPLLPREHAGRPSDADTRYAERVAARLGRTVSADTAFIVPKRKVKDAPDLPPMKAIVLTTRLESGPLVITRVRTQKPVTSQTLLERQIKGSSKQRMVLDQRGADLVILVGSAALKNPKHAGAALEAIWSAGTTTAANRSTTAVFPPARGKDEEYACYTQTNGGFYQAGADLFRVARGKAPTGAGQSGPLSWWFLDDAFNELRVSYASKQTTFHCRALVSPKATMTIALCATRERANEEWDYLLALLDARKTPPKRSKGMIDVLERGK